jgi:hypothetical protein
MHPKVDHVFAREQRKDLEPAYNYVVVAGQCRAVWHKQMPQSEGLLGGILAQIRKIRRKKPATWAGSVKKTLLPDQRSPFTPASTML